MKQNQYYGGSAQEARDGQESQRAKLKAMMNGFTVRHEKRGHESILVIVINQQKEVTP